MSLYYDMSGTWRTVRYVWTKVGGNWREVPQIYVKVNGAWYPIWEYEWVPSSWSSCSKTCGGGTQTRTLTCQRNDGFSYDNSYCEKFAKSSKPATSQSCNTQECTTTYECSATVVAGTDSSGSCSQQSLSPRTGVFPSYKTLRNGQGPFWSGGSNLSGTYYKTSNGGMSCDVLLCDCYLVSGGYKYYMKTTDTPTTWYLDNYRWRYADNGGEGCTGSTTKATCYPMYRDLV